MKDINEKDIKEIAGDRLLFKLGIMSYSIKVLWLVVIGSLFTSIWLDWGYSWKIGLTSLLLITYLYYKHSKISDELVVKIYENKRKFRPSSNFQQRLDELVAKKAEKLNKQRYERTKTTIQRTNRS